MKSSISSSSSSSSSSDETSFCLGCFTRFLSTATSQQPTHSIHAKEQICYINDAATPSQSQLTPRPLSQIQMAVHIFWISLNYAKSRKSVVLNFFSRFLADKNVATNPSISSSSCGI